MLQSTETSSWDSALLSWATHSGGSQLPWCEDRHQVLRRDPCDEELRPPANSRMREPSWRWTLQPQSSLRMMQPQPTSWRPPHERPWAWITQISFSWVPDSQKLWDNKYLLRQDAKFWGHLLCSHKIIKTASQTWRVKSWTPDLHSANISFPLSSLFRKWHCHDACFSG